MVGYADSGPTVLVAHGQLIASAGVSGNGAVDGLGRRLLGSTTCSASCTCFFTADSTDRRLIQMNNDTSFSIRTSEFSVFLES